ncbi:MAG: hypothetical protein M1480_11585 [Bacteroidetes bacterium]|nr:hypothetical protein [Bacteroidota bacterium]
MKIKFVIFNLIFFLLAFISNSNSQSKINSLYDSLAIHFNRDAEVSVGSFYVGAEFHHSSILPQRISFYYPVANSIDLSSDYFKRDTTYIMSAALKVGNQPFEWIGLKPYSFTSTPYEVKYYKEDSEKSISFTYQLCKDKPAMILTMEITNESNTSKTFDFYTHLETSLKTCHTYKLIDKAWTIYDEKSSTVYSNFDDKGTQYTQVFVSNAGEKPISFNTIGNLNDKGYEDFNLNSVNNKLSEKILSKDKPGIPAAEFIYKKLLAPHQRMTIVQIIGASKQNEGKGIVEYLSHNYKIQVEKFEDYVFNKINEGSFQTTDHSINHTYDWAKAVLAVDQHYIQGQIRPMPCPAEYNFYFTHDVLLTDLAAVNFDLKRVKNDLEYTIQHANKDKIIPHAYYWKDSSYVTEFADADNWNNFWFVITSANYLRHSGDVSFMRKLYPYLHKCIEQTLLNKKDDLIWAYRPDWWDIGRNFGPRAYMTILEIKALRDFEFISTLLAKDSQSILDYEKTADKLQSGLVSKLWNEKDKYLMNYYSDGKIDPHYYMGSLLAAHYNLLDKSKLNELVNTAAKKLLDTKVGIYDVYPMDFQQLNNLWKFAGNEEGDPFLYLNGGIWPHANSWYSLALMAIGKKEEAFNFIKNVMTIDGLINSPNGQPAMYEVRDGNYHDPSAYGKVDKPEFMWAAAWYIYSIYHLYGIDENNWNIVFNPFLPENEKLANFTIMLNNRNVKVDVSGKGNYIESISYDGKEYPSAVIPANLNLSKVEIKLGEPKIPYVKNTNSILNSCSYDLQKKKLDIELKAFKGHKNKTEIISPRRPQKIYIDGKALTSNWNLLKEGNLYSLEINIIHSSSNAKLQIVFE